MEPTTKKRKLAPKVNASPAPNPQPALPGTATAAGAVATAAGAAGAVAGTTATAASQYAHEPSVSL